MSKMYFCVYAYSTTVHNVMYTRILCNEWSEDSLLFMFEDI